MTEEEIRKRAFAMPLTSPAFPPGPYRFILPVAAEVAQMQLSN